MLNFGNVNFNDASTLYQPLVLEPTNGLNTITTPPVGPVIKLYTVETLPTPVTALKGVIVSISDATTPALGSALVGGGAVFCLGLCTGAAWVAV
jgi:hypothetical protein